MDAVSRAALLSSVQRVELSRVKVPFSPFVGQRLVELSTNLGREVDGNEAALSGDRGLQKGTLLSKPKARMDTSHVNCGVLNFAASSLDVPLKACELKEPELVSVPLNTVQQFEQDVCVLTMVWSFLGT